MKVLPYCATCGKLKGNCRHDGGLYMGRKQSMVRHEFVPCVTLKDHNTVVKELIKLVKLARYHVAHEDGCPISYYGRPPCTCEIKELDKKLVMKLKELDLMGLVKK